MYICSVMAIVYQHRRLDTNEIFYIGIGKTEKRAYSIQGRNIHWKRIVEKHGYSIEIIHTGLSYDDAFTLEKLYIEKYGRRDLGFGCLVNMTDGGEGNINPSDETRKRYSERQLGEKNHMYGVTGVNHFRFGVKHTDEARKIISEKRIGIKLTPEHISSIMKANIGRKHTADELQKMSDSQKGEKNHRYGKNGDSCPTSKLSSEIVIWIRNNYIKGDLQYGQGALSRKFGVSRTTIKDIMIGKLWKNI